MTKTQIVGIVGALLPSLITIGLAFGQRQKLPSAVEEGYDLAIGRLNKCAYWCGFGFLFGSMLLDKYL